MFGLTTLLLVVPGTAFDWLWRFNPAAHVAFQENRMWSILLMGLMGTACLLATIGLWRGLRWGIELAFAILGINVIGDIVAAWSRYDYRSLIGVPVAAGIIVYLIQTENLAIRRNAASRMEK